MSVLLIYDGQKLTWDEPGNPATYKASSGLIGPKHRMFLYDGAIHVFMEDYRWTWYEKMRDHGPIPSGIYKVATGVPRNPYATYDPSICGLTNSFTIQQIPRGGKEDDEPGRTTAGRCEAPWANWGYHRVGLVPHSGMVAPHRSGFYIHDSSKGFTHGCVETEQKFFVERLYPYAAKAAGTKMLLTVRYTKGAFRTYGGTFVAGSTPGAEVPDEAVQLATMKIFMEMCDWLDAGGFDPAGPAATAAAQMDAKHPRPKKLDLSPPPQGRALPYDDSMGLSLGRNPIAGLKADVVAKVPGRWRNFI